MACFFARATNQNNGLKETDYRASQNLINRKTATHIVSTFVNEFETEFFKFKTVGIIHKQCVVSLFATLIFSLPVFNNNTVQSASLLWFCCEMLHRLGDALFLSVLFNGKIQFNCQPKWMARNWRWLLFIMKTVRFDAAKDRHIFP